MSLEICAYSISCLTLMSLKFTQWSTPNFELIVGRDKPSSIFFSEKHLNKRKCLVHVQTIFIETSHPFLPHVGCTGWCMCGNGAGEGRRALRRQRGRLPRRPRRPRRRRHRPHGRPDPRPPRREAPHRELRKSRISRINAEAATNHI